MTTGIKKVTAAVLAAVMLMCTISLTSCGGSDSSSEKAGQYNRIAATSVATCEILDKLEVDGVVGVPHTDSYELPERYKGATELGGAMSPDMEILASLEPDIVLTPNSLEGYLKEQYDNAGIESYFLDLKSVEGMYNSITELGKMFGKEDKAAELVAEYEKTVSDIKDKNAGKEAPNVLILMGLPGSYVVATESSYVGNLVKLAGGNNVYGDGDGQDFLNVNPEDMLVKDPDIILRTSHAMPEQVMEMFDREFKEDDIWSHFRAVKENQVFDLENEYFGMSATFRYTEALEKLDPILFQ